MFLQLYEIIFEKLRSTRQNLHALTLHLALAIKSDV